MPRPDTRPGSCRLRIGRCSEAGRAYFLTTVTEGRARLFDDWPAASFMSRILAKDDNWHDAQLLSWVLMPDHWHGLVVLGTNMTLAQVMNRVKGRSAYAFNSELGRHGRVWAPGFHDRAIRREESLLSVARYLIGNPLRAGLVTAIGDYPFWDAAWLTDDCPL